MNLPTIPTIPPHLRAFDGRGVRIALLDSGIHTKQKQSACVLEYRAFGVPPSSTKSSLLQDCLQFIWGEGRLAQPALANKTRLILADLDECYADLPQLVAKALRWALSVGAHIIILNLPAIAPQAELIQLFDKAQKAGVLLLSPSWSTSQTDLNPYLLLSSEHQPPRSTPKSLGQHTAYLAGIASLHVSHDLKFGGTYFQNPLKTIKTSLFNVALPLMTPH